MWSQSVRTDVSPEVFMTYTKTKLYYRRQFVSIQPSMVILYY